MKKNIKITILGIGNLLLQDEGVGIHVAQKLMQRKLPGNIEVIDGGVGGFDLLPIIEQTDKLIVIDAVKTTDPAGTIYRFTPQDIEIKEDKKNMQISLHDLGFMEVVRFCEKQGNLPETVFLGVVPGVIGTGMELSLALRLKIPEVIRLIKAEFKGKLNHPN